MFDLKASLLAALATNNRIDCYLFENIHAKAWATKPPEGKGRSIAAIAAHMHNVRLMWLKAIGAKSLPEKLDESASPKETIAAFGLSHSALAEFLEGALETGVVKGFKPDVGGFFGYLISHDAHHRGQIASLARRLGHPLEKSAGFGMWEWGSWSREV